MKISIVMRFHDDTASGGRKIIYEYANYLAEKGQNVEIIFLADVPYKDRPQNMIKHFLHGVTFLKRKRNQENISWFNLNSTIGIKAAYCVKKKMLSKSDVVVAFDYGIALHMVESGFDTNKLVYMIQHDEKVYNDVKIVRKAWMLPIQKVVVATWLLNLVKPFDDRVALVRNYVRTENFYISNPIENRKHVVSLINHPNKYKDVATGLRALEIVKKEIPDLKVILFGNFEKPTGLPDYVYYLKKLTQNELRENVYNQSAIFLFPSILEGWGLVATEAMASGAALVSTRNGGVDDFGIDGETALLTEVGDFESLAEYIIRLFKNDQMRIKIAENGANLVNSLTFESSASQFEKVLYNVAERIN